MFVEEYDTRRYSNDWGWGWRRRENEPLYDSPTAFPSDLHLDHDAFLGGGPGVGEDDPVAVFWETEDGRGEGAVEMAFCG